MAFTAYFFLVAFLCTAHASPVPQTTVCETTPNVHPVHGSTIVCEKSANYLPYILPPPVPYPALGPTVYESTPNVLPYGYLPYPFTIPYGYGSTSVIETAPSVVSIVSQPSVPVSANVGSTTVCETSSNVHPPPAVVSIQPYVYPQVSANVGATTVCESTPSVVSACLPLPYPGLLSGLGVAPVGVALH